MKIFKVAKQANGHIFNINDHDLYAKLWFDICIWYWLEADIKSMNKVKFYVDLENGPEQEIMDFMRFGIEFVIHINDKTEKLLPYFQNAWQVIPLNMLKWKPFDDLKCNIFNITHIVDCFNEEKSECDYHPNSIKILTIKNYVFNENSIPEWTWFFSIPNRKVKNVLLVTGTEKPEEDFYFLYHKLWMTGLKFKEIYRSSWEKDYDLEWTIEAMDRGEELENPLFKKGIFWRLFS